jgi:hypothetical protein
LCFLARSGSRLACAQIALDVATRYKSSVSAAVGPHVNSLSAPRRKTMKLALALVLAALTVSGCVLVPAGPPGSGAYVAVPAPLVVRPPVVVVRPYYRVWGY